MTPDAFVGAPGEVLEALADPHLVDRWLDLQTLDDRPHMVRAVDIARTARGDTPMGAHLLAGRLAEADGDLAGFLDGIEGAVLRDPGWLPVVRELAYTALLRGQARAALRFAEVAGLHLSGPTADVLARATRPSEPGRNHRCPCGSGRKSKHCCAEPPPPLWQRAHLLYEKLCAFGERWHNDARVERICADLVGSDEPLLAGLASTRLDAWPFIVFGTGLVDRFADDGISELLPRDERVLLDAWRGLPVRLLRLDEVLPATGARLTDTLTGERFQAAVSLDGSWHHGEEVFAFLVPVGDVWLLPGTHPILPPHWRDDVVASVDTTEPLEVGRWVVRTSLGADLFVLGRERQARARFVLPGAEIDDDGWISEDEILHEVRRAHPDLEEVDALLLACAARRIVDDDPPGTYEAARSRVDGGDAWPDVLRDLGAAIAAELLARADAT